MKKFLKFLGLLLVLLIAVTVVRDLFTPDHPMLSSVRGIFLARREYSAPTAAVVKRVEAEPESPDLVIRKMAVSKEGPGDPDEKEITIKETNHDESTLIVIINGREVRIPYDQYRERILLAAKSLSKDIVVGLGQNTLTSFIVALVSKFLSKLLSRRKD